MRLLIKARRDSWERLVTLSILSLLHVTTANRLAVRTTCSTASNAVYASISGCGNSPFCERSDCPERGAGGGRKPV